MMQILRPLNRKAEKENDRLLVLMVKLMRLTDKNNLSRNFI